MNWLKIACIVTLLTATAYADVKVTITGPDKADSGFALVGSADAPDAVLRWRIDGPEKAVPPLELLDSQGRPVLVFMSPVAGRYKITLTGQVAVDGLDPWGETSHVVVVGKVPPKPGPNPGPTPGPDVPTPPTDPLARQVYDAAMKVQSDNRAAEAKMFADIFEAVSGQAAGVSTMTVDDMVKLTARQMQSQVPPDVRLRWDGWKASFSSIMGAAGLTTKEQHIAAWANFASALRGVR